MVTAMGQGDYIKYIQTLPGVATGADGSSAFYVRGGNLGSNVITLDGAPVFGASHLLGTMTAVSNDVISESEFCVGGFASDEGNLTASHVRLKSASGDYYKWHGSGDLSNFMGGATISGPVWKDRISVFASGRFSPIQSELKALESLLPEDLKGTNASVWDAFGKVSARLWKGSSLEASLFRSMDDYSFNYAGSDSDRMGWQNQIANIRWAWDYRRWTFTAGWYIDSKKSRQEQAKEMAEAMSTFVVRDSLVEKGLDLKTEFRLIPKLTLSGGFKSRNTSFNPGSATSYTGNSFREGREMPLQDNFMSTKFNTLHFQTQWQDGDKLNARLAMRHNKQGVIKGNDFSAMVRWRYRTWLGIEATADKLMQFYHTLEGLPLGWSLDMMTPSDFLFKPEEATQLFLGFFGEYKEHSWTLGGYWKDMDNLVYFMEATRIFSTSLGYWRDNVYIGSGRSYGLETTYNYLARKWKVNVAYTLSKTDRHFDFLNAGQRFPAKFDRRHVLNITGKYILHSSERIEAGFSSFVTLQSGYRETVPAGHALYQLPNGEDIDFDFFTTENNYAMPTLFRWDAGWFLDLKGKSVTHRINLGVYNLTNRHNPFMIVFEADNNAWKQVSLFPIMPSLNYRIEF